MLAGFPATRLAAQRSEQKPGVKKVKLPEKASEAIRQVFRSLRLGAFRCPSSHELGRHGFCLERFLRSMFNVTRASHLLS
jgi:hypothetical protein